MKGLLIPGLVVVILGFFMVAQRITPAPKLMEGRPFVFAELPGYTDEVVEPSPGELELLPADAYVCKRRYTRQDGNWYLVSAVHSASAPHAIHRPELCLPGQGFTLSNLGSATIDGIDWQFLGLDGAHGTGHLDFAYTFYDQTGFRTCSNSVRVFREIIRRTVFGRIDRWVMVTVATPDREKRSVREFLGKLKEMMP